MENILYLRIPARYNISSKELLLLNEVNFFTKIGDYAHANKICQNILEKFGPSGIMYERWAKILEYEGRYEEAIYLLYLTNELCIKYYHIENINCLKSIETLKTKKTWEKDF
jgi:tetratricopeptide (TPR) repeat protein